MRSSHAHGGSETRLLPRASVRRERDKTEKAGAPENSLFGNDSDKIEAGPNNKAGFAEIPSDSLAALVHQPHGTLQPTSNDLAMLGLVLLALLPQIGAFYL
jgi:hypothetical protein